MSSLPPPPGWGGTPASDDPVRHLPLRPVPPYRGVGGLTGGWLVAPWPPHGCLLVGSPLPYGEGGDGRSPSRAHAHDRACRVLPAGSAGSNPPTVVPRRCGRKLRARPGRRINPQGVAALTGPTPGRSRQHAGPPSGCGFGVVRYRGISTIFPFFFPFSFSPFYPATAASLSSPSFFFSFFFFPSSYPATAASLSSPSFFFFLNFSFSLSPQGALWASLLSRAPPPFLPLAPVHEHAHAPSPSSPVRACLLAIVRVAASSPPRPRCCLAVLRP